MNPPQLWTKKFLAVLELNFSWTEWMSMESASDQSQRFLPNAAYKLSTLLEYGYFD